MKFRLSGILMVSSIALLGACASSTAQEASAPQADNDEQRVWVSRQRGHMPRPHHMRMDGDHGMMDMDSNDDGLISKEEFDDHHGLKFDEMDGDGDGFISEDEVEDYAEAIVEDVMEGLDFAFEFDTEEFEEEMEELEEEMERMGEEMSRAGERMSREMRRHGRDFERRREVIIVDERDIEIRIEEQKDNAFARLDKDEDGKISRDEYPGPDRRFNNMDENNDGYVMRDEMKVRMRITNSISHRGRSGEEIEIIIDEDEE